jgi:L-2-hydroxycarboxylate dehydrogenase (NAD+)
MKLVSHDQARSVATAALLAAGVPQAHAEIQTDLLLEAELRGRASHGLLRLPRIVDRIRNGVADPNTRGISSWRGSFLSVDGSMGLGPVVADHALQQLAGKARDNGLAAAGIRNNNHIGMLAWYAERVAKDGLILIALSTSEALVHPWGGRSAMLGTNPIAIGIPTADGPFVVDMATSLVSMGQIHDYADRGKPLPEGWAIDAAGDPTTDAAAAKCGAIAPFGGPKGYALGLAFELLVTALTGAAIGTDVRGTLDDSHPCNKGDVFITMTMDANPALRRQLSAYLDAVRQSGGDHTVTVPGDRALAQRARSIAEGISLPPALWNKLNTLAGTEPGPTATEGSPR